MRQVLYQSENRELFLTLLENDYKTYDIDYLRAEPVPSSVRVVLPNVIFGNLGDCIYVFLETLCKDAVESDC